MAQHKLYSQLKTNFTSTLKNSYTKLHIHTICSTHFIFFWFIDPDNIRCRIQIMKLFIVLFYPLFWYFLICYTTLKSRIDEKITGHFVGLVQTSCEHVL